MTIEVKIIADSVCATRVTSFQLRYPRYFHSEVLTHRVFSRSSSSSRAIPVLDSISRIETDPVEPIEWGKNQRGMQAVEEIDELAQRKAKYTWHRARENAVNSARELVELGVHKQIVNRLLEPFAHIDTIITATDWDNFFNLRCHQDALPEFRELAVKMRDALKESEPNELSWDEWHLPYVEERDLPIDTLLKMSVARCARVSYNKHDGTQSTVEEDIKLFERLMERDPKHASPAEHQCKPGFGHDRNFYGWKQYRAVLEER